jgi:exodeoxyribonuclease VII large subunit
MQYIAEENILTLHQLNVLIQNVIDTTFFGKYFWVKAEIHKLNIYKYSGHAYPELLEKKDNQIVCQMRGIIWKSDLIRINENFINTLGEPLKENINALLYATVKFDPRYGLSLQIKDIDPNYSLGELEKQKKQTIEKLKQEGIFDNNKKLELSLVPQKLAIISVETSKGFNDLITTFQKYSDRFQILYDLYPSLLQGEGAAMQITEHLNNIKKKHHLYDAVLIIRGGGGEVGLSCYNDYELCKTIATFPIPVITGIGHSTNFTIAEMVAHQNGITPTDTAMIIIQQFEKFEQQLINAQNTFIQFLKQYISQQNHLLSELNQQLVYISQNILHENLTALNEFEQNLKNLSKNIINKKEKHLIQLANKLYFSSKSLTSKRKNKLDLYQQDLIYLFKNKTSSQLQKLNFLQSQIIQSFQNFLNKQNKHIQSLEKNLNILHPNNILKRGYSIVFDKTNKTISNVQMLNENDSIKIKFHSSEAILEIKNITKHYTNNQ